MLAYLDSHLREVVGVAQGGSDVEAELFTVLNGGVPKPDAHGPSLHRKQHMTIFSGAQAHSMSIFPITMQYESCTVVLRRCPTKLVATNIQVFTYAQFWGFLMS